MADTVKIKVGIAVNYIANSDRDYVVEYDRAKWDAMSEAEREALLEEFAQGEIDDHVEAYACLAEDEEG